MPMNEDCKHFASRTYPDGETARFCLLDLAPEAPWRCPENCSRYEKRLADVGWVHGTVISPAIEDEPDGSPQDIVSVLNDAEDIVNDEVIREESKKKKRRFFRF
jgi:hypothetical protein